MKEVSQFGWITEWNLEKLMCVKGISVLLSKDMSFSGLYHWLHLLGDASCYENGKQLANSDLFDYDELV